MWVPAPLTSVQRPFARMFAAAATLLIILLLASPPVSSVTPEIADLNGDGIVNVLDFRLLAIRNQQQLGQAGYLEGMDLLPDGIIDITDLGAIRPVFRRSADNLEVNTHFRGRVFDSFGNPLPGVKIFLGSGIPLEDLLSLPCNPPTCGVSDATGQYRLDSLPVSVHGVVEVSFISNEVIDPTPTVLSGEFASIPHKPVFINAGVTTTFRDIPIPERDLTGAVNIGSPGTSPNVNATLEQDGSLTLNQAAEVDSGLVRMLIQPGCKLQFPNGEPSRQLSITRLTASAAPVAMPPGEFSNLLVTFQPGGTVVTCPSGSFVVEFDNIDGYPITRAGTDPGDIPNMNGITNGAFTALAACTVEDRNGNDLDPDVNDTIACIVPTPFSFAWYGASIGNTVCIPTTVIGQVMEYGTGTPIANAQVTVAAAAPVLTNLAGMFEIATVAAGPNGPFCQSRPFDLHVTATGNYSGGADTSVSNRVAAVSGGVTDVGTIYLGNPGVWVGGSTLILSRINPPLETALPNADVTFVDAAGTTHNTLSDPSGNYGIANVELGPYSSSMHFVGGISLPGGGTVTETVDASQVGELAGTNIPKINDFRATSFGAVEVTVLDKQGNPIPNAKISISGPGATFGSYRIDSWSSATIGNTDMAGTYTFPAGFSGPADADIPMGPCIIFAVNSADEFIAAAGEQQGCFINEHGELTHVTVQESDTLAADVIDISIGVAWYDHDLLTTTPNIEVLEIVSKLSDSQTNFFVNGPTPGRLKFAGIIDLDLDRNASTGIAGEVESSTGLGTGLGVEMSYTCKILPGSVINCLKSNQTYVDAVAFFPDMDQGPAYDPDFSTLVVLIPTQNQGPFLGIGKSANVVVAGKTEDTKAPGGTFFDVIPNTGFIGSNNFNAWVDTPDPIGDTF